MTFKGEAHMVSLPVNRYANKDEWSQRASSGDMSQEM